MRKHTDAEMIEALRRAGERTAPDGMSMAVYDATRDAAWPAGRTIYARFGSWGLARVAAGYSKRVKSKAKGWRSPRGYVYLGRQLEHRVVMELRLGRALLPGETVHHKNGVRYDNDDSNLELRIKAHPKGLSVAEALDWAHEIIRRYA